MIFTRELRKSFGSRCVLTGLDLDIEPGALTLLVGSNGAGKTTVLRLLAGLSVPDGGSIEIGGRNLARQRQAVLTQLSFLPQAPRFHPRLTVRQVADFHGHLRGRTHSDSTESLDFWGMADFADVPTGKLSGGLRQRLALAIFSLAVPSVLLLDEPGLSLDPEWREVLQQFLRREARRGCTVLVATHLLGEWEGRADRCMLIERGRAQGELPPDQLRQHFPRLHRESALEK